MRTMFTMRTLVTAFAITLGLTIVMLSAEVRLEDGSKAPLEVVEERGDRVLLKSERGFGYVPKEWLAGQKLDLLGVDDALKRANTQLAVGDNDGAFQTLMPLVEQIPSHVEARRLLALAQRRRGRFEAAYFLISGLISEEKKSGKASREMLVEHAELAVLMRDRKLARKAFSAMHQIRDLRSYERKLSRQLDGGTPVTFASPLPKEFSKEALTVERAGNDNARGTHLIGSRLSAQIEKRLNASTYGVTEDVPFVRQIRVITKAPKEAYRAYERGESEERFASLVYDAFVVIAVDNKRWLSIFDWQKKVEVNSAAHALINVFPNAQIGVQIVGQKGEAKESRYTVARATAIRRSKNPQITLMTAQKFDAQRPTIVQREIRDYRRNRGSGR